MLIAFACIVIIFDILMYFYKCNNKIFNIFLISIMSFGHPLYFFLSFAIVFSLGLLYDGFNITLIGFILLCLLMIAFGLIRHYIFRKIFDKKMSLCQFSRLYFFTIFCIPFYTFIQNGELGLAIMFQGVLPICFVCVFIYSIIKVFIVKSVLKKYTS